MDNKKTILIVDDDPSNIIALTQILSPEYTVYAVKSGEEAIEAAEKFLPDLILLDIIMPEMDGYETLFALNCEEKAKDIPVIFVTGLDGVGDEKRGLLLGAADYITKPFAPELLLKRVKTHLVLKNQERELKKLQNYGLEEN